jgi:hypothetical protein
MRYCAIVREGGTVMIKQWSFVVFAIIVSSLVVPHRHARARDGEVRIYDIPISRVKQAVNAAHRVMRVAPLPVRVCLQLHGVLGSGRPLL